MDDFLVGREGTLESRGWFTLPRSYRVRALRPLGYLTCIMASLIRAGARRIDVRERGGWLRFETDVGWPAEDEELGMGLEASPGFRWRGKNLEVRITGDWRPLFWRYSWSPAEVQLGGQVLTCPIEVPECLLGRRLVGSGPARGEPAGLWNQERPAAFDALLGLGRRVHTAFARPPSLVLVVDGLRLERDGDLGLPEAYAVVWGADLRRTDDGLDLAEDFRYQKVLEALRWHFRDMLPELARRATTSALRRLAEPVLGAGGEE